MNQGLGYPLIGVVGPTATGKSELAIHLARSLGGEIINCDSMQVYLGLDIGTAKPSPEIRRQIRHHLIDVVEVGDFFSAGHFQKLARNALDDICGRGRVPILVGGTGFYLRSLLYGIFAGPERSEDLRRRFKLIAERRGVKALHAILKRKDPAAAERIPPADFQRIARALEVFYLTGRPMSAHFGTSEEPIQGFRKRIYCITLPRQVLVERINQRVLNMINAGWMEETSKLLAAGLSPQAKGLDAIGYREIAAHLRGECTITEAINLIQTSTRQFAKRQLTWFRKEQDLVWIEGAGEDPSVQAKVLGDIKEYFKL